MWKNNKNHVFLRGGINMLSHVKGYVRIKIWGNGVTRFLNLCSKKRMYLWNIEAKNKYTYVNIYIKDFFQCRKIAKKAGIRAVVVERHGLPFYIPRFLKRIYFLIGFILFLVCVFINTNMLLKIELNGNYSITDDVLMDFLETQNVRCGMWLKDIPIEELEKKLRNEFDLITWTSAKLDGTILIIDMKENEKPEIIVEDKKNLFGSNIYASSDGIIHSIYVKRGVPKVKKGDEVHKDDLLVDGLVPIFNQEGIPERYQYYDADAKILIACKVPVNLQLESVYLDKKYTSREKTGIVVSVDGSPLLRLLHQNPFQKADHIYVPKYLFMLAGKEVSVGKYILREYIETESLYSKEEAEALLQQEFEKNNVLLLEKGVQILEKDVTIDLIMGNWTLVGEMDVIMPAYYTKMNEFSEDKNDPGMHH